MFKLAVDREALKKFRLVVVAYSSVQREHFATKDAYEAEVEVEGGNLTIHGVPLKPATQDEEDKIKRIFNQQA